MKKYLKIDKAIYEVDENARTYKFIKRNFNWNKLSEEENINNKKITNGYTKITENKTAENVKKDTFLNKLIQESPSRLIENLSSNNSNLKFTSSKALIEMSEQSPKEIYPDFDEFVSILNSENNIIKWTGIIIIGNLSIIDKDKKIDKIMPKLFKLLNTGKMITAGNATVALGKIAGTKPELASKITTELLKVKGYKYDTSECNNIALGHVINAFDSYLIKPNKKVLDFTIETTKNTRNSTAKKAEKYLLKISKKGGD